MKGPHILNLTQYNFNKSKDRVQQHFLQMLDPLIHHVVALQEPWCHPTKFTTVKHPAYHLVFPDGQKSRTCIYVSKNLAVEKRRREKTPEEAGGDMTSINLLTDKGKIFINNVYNLPPLFHGSNELGTLKFLEELLSKEGQHILVADFNFHHPRWGGQTVLSHHKLSEDLIDILGSKNLELILPEGTITWSNRGSQSTLDLTFVSKNLEDTVTKCLPANELEASSDHIPICTEMLIQPEVQKEQAARPQWKKADWEAVNRSLAAKLRLLERERHSLNSPETIDQRVISITEITQVTIKETIPGARPSSLAKPYWTSESSKAVKDTRKARRKWKTLGTKDCWLDYLTSTSIKKAQIQKAKNIGWRATVSEAAQDPTKIWKLAKWARKDSEERHRLPYP
ncbi:hypothetical protein K3495_g10034 [Podosphaera aphanis]|nr:hypothetical protein K3495_g10034 [Podosphaera aphanis]